MNDDHIEPLARVEQDPNSRAIHLVSIQDLQDKIADLSKELKKLQHQIL